MLQINWTTAIHFVCRYKPILYTPRITYSANQCKAQQIKTKEHGYSYVLVIIRVESIIVLAYLRSEVVVQSAAHLREAYADS